MDTCLGFGPTAIHGRGCWPRDLIEIAAAHPLRPAHGGGGSPVMHGAVGNAVAKLPFRPDYGAPVDGGSTDADEWRWMVRGLICPFEEMSTAHVFDCMHGVGHGAMMRAYAMENFAVQSARWRGEKLPALWGPEKRLRVTTDFCEAAPTRALGYDCAVGAYMQALFKGGIPFPRPERGWAWPCGTGEVPFPASCFVNLLLERRKGTGVDERAIEVDCRDTAFVRTAHARLGCIFARANVEFAEFDGFLQRSNISSAGGCSYAKEQHSQLDFLQGSGYSHGAVRLAARGHAKLCGRIPADCTADERKGNLEAPSTLRRYCEALVGVPRLEADGSLGAFYRASWLACVAGAVGYGVSEAISGADYGTHELTNVATIVDMYDIPSFVIRRVCHQLRHSPRAQTEAPPASSPRPAVIPSGVNSGGDPLEELGEEAASVCERHALYFALRRPVEWMSYRNWPDEILDQFR
jgi:hypothetical protein